MTFNPYYSVSALVVGALIIIFFYSKKYFPSRENRAFVLFVVFTTIATALDVLTMWTLGHTDKVPYGLNIFLNTIYYMTTASCFITYFMFVRNLTRDGKKDKFLPISVIAWVLYAVSMVSLMVNPWTKIIFAIDKATGAYIHGILFESFHIIAIIVILLGYILSFSARKRLKFVQMIVLYSTAPVMIACMLYQVFNTDTILVDLGIAVVCLALFETLQNPAELVDSNLGCFNETAFQKMLDMKIAANDEFTVMAYEFDGFEFVNRFLGIENGEELLASVCEEVSANIKGNIYHLEGTRFAVISDKKSVEVKTNSEWLFWRFLSSFLVNNVEVALTVRACALNYPETAETKDEIINALTYTLEEITHENETELVWTTKERIKAFQRNTMITHILKRAILNQEFEVFFQPIYSVKENAFRSSEALIRLKDPEIGFISPEEFIPVAEKNGLILEIGDIVFDKVCDFLSSGDAAALGIQFIEVNLSMVQCSQEGLAKHLIEVMDRYRLPYSMIDFEITETFDIKDNKALHKNMNDLIAVGSNFALDDYGTGFSNANYLMEYPFKLVKLDKSFIWGAMENKDANIILKHSISMIKELDKHIVAEGVETLEQARILIDLGCEYLQGYYFSPPVSVERYVSYLENQAERVKEEFAKEIK